MTKKFTQLSIKEKLRYFKRKKFLLIALEYALLIIPFAILLIVKRKEYFTSTNQIDMTFGLVLSLIVLMLLLTKKATFLKGCGGYIVVFILCFLFRTIINDLLIILGVGMIGAVSKPFIDTISLNRTREICDAFNKAVLNKEVLNSDEKMTINQFGNAE